MATVTGLTAQRMLEIEASAIIGGAVDLNGHLQLETHGGQTMDAGLVRGEAGVGPSGTVVMHAAPTPPPGWLSCDGSAVSRAVYPGLFSSIGTTYGVGDGSTTFNLPNLRGRVAVGFGGSYDTMGATGGAETVTLTADQMPVHTHTQNPHSHVQNSHTHTQSAHNHAQNSHNHAQNSHNHSASAHSHGSAAHNHSQGAHLHGSDGGALGWRGNTFGSGSLAGIAQDGSARNTSSTTASNASTSVTTYTETSANVAATATNTAATATNTAATATNNAATATNNTATATNNNTTATNNNAGGGAAHPNMQPFMVLNYIIKT